LGCKRVVIHGAGTAGIDIADMMCDVMIREGLSEQEATGRFWTEDSRGLVTEDAPEAPAEIDLREEAPAPATRATEPVAPAKRTVTSPKRPPSRKAQTTADAGAATSGLRAAQFYLDDRCDDYLRSIRAEALMRRLDVSGSAVVRFAVHRLLEELTPAQVADRLAEPVAERDGTGRKRH
jgi:hypothetical protein